VRRFFIHGYKSVTWTLVVSDGRPVRWHVEKAEPGPERSRLDLDEFKKSGRGKQLAPQLAGALEEARQQEARTPFQFICRTRIASTPSARRGQESNGEPSEARQHHVDAGLDQRANAADRNIGTGEADTDGLGLP
jgi:hypothetical protein